MAGQSTENNKFTFTWKIEDLMFYGFQSDLNSPLFNIKTSNCLTSWYLCFSDALYLVKKGSELFNENIGYKIELMDTKLSRETRNLLLIDCDKCSFTVDQSEDEKYAEIYYKNFLLCYFCNNRNSITFRFIMNLPESVTDRFCACKARTKIETEQRSFKWNVKNLSTVDEVSKVFPCSSSVQVKMTISKCETFVSIIIELMEAIEENFVVCKIALLDVNGFVIDSRKDMYSTNEDGKIWEFPNFIKTSDLFTAGSKFIEYDCFSLLCKFSISEGATLEEVSYCSDDNPAFLKHDRTIHSLANLQENFRRMYIERLNVDLEVRASGQTLQAHKCVLSARSPVFAAMFDKNMMENQTGVVDIPDIDGKILDILFLFMYDGTVANLDYDSAYNLLVAADKYQVIDLKEICSDFLMSNLDNDNVCNVLALADEVSHEVLKDSAVHYIVEHADEILTTETWLHFIQSKFNLVTEVIRKFSFLYAFYKNFDT